MQWINEAGLATWAGRVDARLHLADMIADLIRASIKDASRFRFPGGDSGQIRGWDGSLETVDAAAFVPSGKSKWEFGTGAGAKKATSDYKSRTSKTDAKEMAENTLVLVNLERWDTPRTNLTAWENEKRAEKAWKDVRYFDAVELVHWLDLHPAVAAKYARDVLNLSPKDGASSTDEFWATYSARFKPPLNEKVVIADRQDIADSLLHKLAGPAQAILLGAESGIEVVAFAVAAIRTAKPEVRRALELRTLIVESEAAAKFLRTHEGLTFITTKSGDALSGMLSLVAPTLSAATGVQARKHEVLARSAASGMVDGFVEMGLDREEGYELAHRCGRSLTILHRLIPNQPIDVPEWVGKASELKAAFLAGGWSASQNLDKAILQELSGCADYAELEQILLPSTNLADPPIDRVGDIWQVRAPVDAFSFYGHLIGERDLQRLKEASIKVFSHSVDAPSPEEKFSLSYVSPIDYSKWLREGLALTLLIIATMNKLGGLQFSNSNAQLYVDEILSALPDWGRSHRTLLGLSDQTALLAEAAPNPFLSALESMLGGQHDEVTHLFARHGDTLFGPTSPHVYVLWALEVLAWEPALLSRTALILAGLASLDPEPDSRMVNRPINSLRAIFLTWSPSTNATLKQRIACIDQVIAAFPEVGWQLLVKLLPQSSDSTSPTAKPKLRDSAPLEKEELTFGVVWKGQHAVVNRAIKFAENNEDRIVLLVKAFSSFRPEDREATIALFDGYLESHKSEVANPVWSALRAEVSKHVFFADSDWAMQENELKSIEAMLELHRPDDSLAEDKQLFDDWMPHMGRYNREEVHDPDDARIVALERILSRDGPIGILHLAQRATLPQLIGPLLDRINIDESQLFTLLQVSIESSAPGDLATSASAVGATRYGQEWANSLQERTFPSIETIEGKVQLLLGWPLEAWTWNFIELLGQEVYEKYWRSIYGLPRNGPSDDLLRAVNEFRRVNRSIDVLGSVYGRLKELPTDLIVSILNEGKEQLADFRIAGGYTMLAHYLGLALDELLSRDEVTKEDVAKQEYGYLALLGNGRRQLILYDYMAEDGAFFVDVISHVFRAKNASSELQATDQDRARANVSFRLLSSFSTVPGTKEGVVDEMVLKAWVSAVREAAERADRSEIADQHIGQVLARAVQDPKESFWPPSAVCSVIEKFAAQEIERGFEIECFNKRGAYSKGLNEGGEQERVLAKKYEVWATETSDYPRTSAVLSRLANTWSELAVKEDLRAELEKMKR